MVSQEQWEQLVRFLEDRLDQKFDQRDDRLRERLKAVAQSVTRLADGLSSAESQRRQSYQEIKDALISVLGVTGEALNIQREELEKLPVETLADLLHYTTVNKVRDLQFRRGDVPAPAPLPPVPVTVESEDSLVVKRHTEGNGEREDSLVIRTHKDGSTRIESNIKTKTLLGWIAGLVMAGLYLWEKIKPFVH